MFAVAQQEVKRSVMIRHLLPFLGVEGDDACLPASSLAPLSQNPHPHPWLSLPLWRCLPALSLATPIPEPMSTCMVISAPVDDIFAMNTSAGPATEEENVNTSGSITSCTLLCFFLRLVFHPHLLFPHSRTTFHRLPDRLVPRPPTQSMTPSIPLATANRLLFPLLHLFPRRAQPCRKPP